MPILKIHVWKLRLNYITTISGSPSATSVILTALTLQTLDARIKSFSSRNVKISIRQSLIRCGWWGSIVASIIYLPLVLTKRQRGWKLGWTKLTQLEELRQAAGKRRVLTLNLQFPTAPPDVAIVKGRSSRETFRKEIHVGYHSLDAKYSDQLAPRVFEFLRFIIRLQIWRKCVHRILSI